MPPLQSNRITGVDEAEERFTHIASGDSGGVWLDACCTNVLLSDDSDTEINRTETTIGLRGLSV